MKMYTTANTAARAKNAAYIGLESKVNIIRDANPNVVEKTIINEVMNIFKQISEIE